MLTDLERISARLSMFELVLETLYADRLSQAPSKKSEISKNWLTWASRNPSLDMAEGFTPEQEQREAEMVAEMSAITDRFLDKVNQREEEIRSRPRPEPAQA